MVPLSILQPVLAAPISVPPAARRNTTRAIHRSPHPRNSTSRIRSQEAPQLHIARTSSVFAITKEFLFTNSRGNSPFPLGSWRSTRCSYYTGAGAPTLSRHTSPPSRTFTPAAFFPHLSPWSSLSASSSMTRVHGTNAVRSRFTITFQHLDLLGRASRNALSSATSSEARMHGPPGRVAGLRFPSPSLACSATPKVLQRTVQRPNFASLHSKTADSGLHLTLLSAMHHFATPLPR